MPLFDIVCNNCDYKGEVLSLTLTIKCPKCHSKDIRREMPKTAPPVFKGTGFYATDYKKKASK